MNILFLTSSLGLGGAERVASTLCNAWSIRGDHVTLVPTYSGGGTSSYPIDTRVRLIFLRDISNNSTTSGKNYLRRLKTLREMIRLEQPDVVISFLPNVNVAAVLATIGTRIPVVIGERSDPSMRAESWIWRSACKITYRWADCLSVQTKSASDAARDIYKEVKNIVVLPNPLPPGLLTWRFDRISRDRKILLSLGRLSKEKQVTKIIAAFSELQQVHRDWDLHIYGEGPLRNDLASEIDARGLGDRIFLKGATKSPWKVMSGADAFVMASRYEGFPNALLEAMGVGLPCVSTDCRSGPREISEDGRFACLVSPDNQSELVTSLSRLMGDETLRLTLGDEAREFVRQRYALPSVLAAWDRVFESVGVHR